MLDLDKNSDYLWLQTGHKQGEYYDLNSELNQGELWNKLALDQMIEMVLVTEPQERLFNLAFGSPVYQILFEKFKIFISFLSYSFNPLYSYIS